MTKKLLWHHTRQLGRCLDRIVKPNLRFSPLPFQLLPRIVVIAASGLLALLLARRRALQIDSPAHTQLVILPFLLIGLGLFLLPLLLDLSVFFPPLVVQLVHFLLLLRPVDLQSQRVPPIPDRLGDQPAEWERSVDPSCEVRHPLPWFDGRLLDSRCSSVGRFDLVGISPLVLLAWASGTIV